MRRGEVVSIHVTSVGGEPMGTVREVRAVAGVGLEGDRYAEGTGTYSKKVGPDRHVTLIAAEALEAMRRERGIDLAPERCRRNIVTRGVALDGLVGKTFRVGAATLRGVRPNEPCRYLENLLGLPGLEEALLGRSGLNAEVVEGGLIRQGDPIEEE